MKAVALATLPPITLTLLTKRPEDVRRAREVVAHAYPDATFEVVRDVRALEGVEEGVALIDVEAVSEAQLTSLLDAVPERMAILVVKELSEIRRFSHFLTGRRAVVTRVDLHGTGLIGAIHHLLERNRLHEQLKNTARHLKELSIRDELTKLFNHRHFDELLSAEVKKAARYKRPLSLVIVAIKKFTALKEAFGQHEIDRAVLRVAELIRGIVRDVDVPARFGDNEFAILLPESDEAAARTVAGRIRDAISAVELPGEGPLSHLAASFGVAALSAKIQSKDDLVRIALGALLAARREGNGAICSAADVEAHRRELHENRQLIEHLGERVQSFADEAQQGYFRSVLRALSDHPIMKKHLMHHSERVAFFAQRLAEHGANGAVLPRALYRAGLLHDIGKLAIDPDLLVKEGRLVTTEEALVRKHPLFAVQILGTSPLIAFEADAILHHHERFDGSGYPDGLAGEKISLAARILAIAEAWDVMTSPQPYRSEPLSLDIAVTQLHEGAGTQFDPVLVERFAALIVG